MLSFPKQCGEVHAYRPYRRLMEFSDKQSFLRSPRVKFSLQPHLARSRLPPSAYGRIALRLADITQAPVSSVLERIAMHIRLTEKEDRLCDRELNESLPICASGLISSSAHGILRRVSAEEQPVPFLSMLSRAKSPLLTHGHRSC